MLHFVQTIYRDVGQWKGPNQNPYTLKLKVEKRRLVQKIRPQFKRLVVRKENLSHLNVWPSSSGVRISLLGRVFATSEQTVKHFAQNFLLLIENFTEHGSWTIFHAQTEIPRPYSRTLDQTKKLWTMIKILSSTAIVVDHCQS